MTTNVYRKGVIIATFDYEIVPNGNPRPETIYEIMCGAKVKGEWKGCVMGRVTESSTPKNFAFETLAMSYSNRHPGCFWIIQKDVSWGK